MKQQMKRSTSTPRSVLGSMFILCYCAPVFTAAAQPIRFRFDPPEDFAYISTVKHKHTQDLIENSVDVGKRTRTTEGRAKITVEKKPDGYSVTFALFSFSMTQNGKPADNPVIEFLQTIALTYELDADGKLVEIAGVEGMFEEFMASLPAELPPGVAEMLDEDALRKKSDGEWNWRIG